MKVEKSMLLIHAKWQGVPTFKMIPISKDCPYTECLFDPSSKIFVIVGKDKKTGLHLMPKLNEFGDPETCKTGPRPNGQTVKEQRITLETWQEYYVEDREDAISIIDMFSVNAAKFDYRKFFDNEVPLDPKKIELIS